MSEPLLNPEPTPTPAPKPEPTPTPEPPPLAAVTWDQIKASLPEELRAEKSLEVITSPEALVKSYVHAQKSMGKDKLVIPDKHATPDDWKQVYSKLGNPEKLEDYKINLEGDNAINEEVMNKVKAAAHEAGVLPHQFEKIVNVFNATGTELSTSQQAAAEAQYTEQVEALKKEWGEQYDTQLRKANIAFKEFMPEQEQREAFIKSGMGGDPRIVRILANAAKLLSEDVFLGHGDGKLGGMTPQDALLKAKDIQGNPDHAYRNPAHPNHKAAKEEVANLYKIAYPE